MLNILDLFIVRPVAKVPTNTESKVEAIKTKLISRYAEGNVALAQGKFNLGPKKQ